jgi:hypothetical protein
MSLVKSAESSGPPPQALMDAMAKLSADSFKSGVLVELGGLLQSARGFRLRIAGGKLTVTDGPFTEAKEVVGGYAVLEVESREQAIKEATHFMELHHKHWPGWEGECEVRQLNDPMPNPAAGPRR